MDAIRNFNQLGTPLYPGGPFDDFGIPEGGEGEGDGTLQAVSPSFYPVDPPGGWTHGLDGVDEGEAPGQGAEDLFGSAGGGPLAATWQLQVGDGIDLPTVEGAVEFQALDDVLATDFVNFNDGADDEDPEAALALSLVAFNTLDGEDLPLEPVDDADLLQGLAGDFAFYRFAAVDSVDEFQWIDDEGNAIADLDARPLGAADFNDFDGADDAAGDDVVGRPLPAFSLGGTATGIDVVDFGIDDDDDYLARMARGTIPLPEDSAYADGMDQPPEPWLEPWF
jgi:hypothetical protein